MDYFELFQKDYLRQRANDQLVSYSEISNLFPSKDELIGYAVENKFYTPITGSRSIRPLDEEIAESWQSWINLKQVIQDEAVFDKVASYCATYLERPTKLVSMSMSNTSRNVFKMECKAKYGDKERIIPLYVVNLDAQVIGLAAQDVVLGEVFPYKVSPGAVWSTDIGGFHLGEQEIPEVRQTHFILALLQAYEAWKFLNMREQDNARNWKIIDSDSQYSIVTVDADLLGGAVHDINYEELREDIRLMTGLDPASFSVYQKVARKNFIENISPRKRIITEFACNRIVAEYEVPDYNPLLECITMAGYGHVLLRNLNQGCEHL